MEIFFPSEKDRYTRFAYFRGTTTYWLHFVLKTIVCRSLRPRRYLSSRIIIRECVSFSL